MPLLTFLLICVLLFLIFFFFGGFFGVIWFPTREKDYEKIADLASLRPDKIFFDLGCGTGDLLFFLSKKYGVKCVGIEISPLLYLYSKIRSLFNKKVKIYFGNLFKINLSEADIIYAFLHPGLLERLENKINQEAKKEVSVVISCWPLKHKELLRVDEKGEKGPYYLYLFKPMPE
jgi:SAM-dependent methyltransferase